MSEAFSDHKGSIKEFIAERPLVSVPDALVFGLALGRMMGLA